MVMPFVHAPSTRLLLYKHRPTTSLRFCPISFTSHHCPWSVCAILYLLMHVLLHGCTRPRISLNAISFMRFACSILVLPCRLQDWLSWWLASVNGVWTTFPLVAHSSTTKAKLLNALITYWLFKLPNENSSDQRLLHIYLNTYPRKSNSSFSGCVSIYFKHIPNGSTNLM